MVHYYLVWAITRVCKTITHDRVGFFLSRGGVFDEYSLRVHLETNTNHTLHGLDMFSAQTVTSNVLQGIFAWLG
jgi:hypothetical protein